MPLLDGGMPAPKFTPTSEQTVPKMRADSSRQVSSKSLPTIGPARASVGRKVPFLSHLFA